MNNNIYHSNRKLVLYSQVILFRLD